MGNVGNARKTSTRVTVCFLFALLTLGALGVLSACRGGGGGGRGSGNGSVGTGTGNAAGDEANAVFLHDEKPVFSDLGGFYTGSMELMVSLPPAYADLPYTIRLTYDGSEPGRTDARYDGSAIRLPDVGSTEAAFRDGSQTVRATVVRAACFDENNRLVGKIATAVFLQVANKNRFTLPVMCLTTDPTNLTGSQSGIFTHAHEKGRAWERPVHVQYFTAQGALALCQDAGIRLFGGSSRDLSQHSFRITARQNEDFAEDGTAPYDGAGKFKYPLFEGRMTAAGAPMTEYDSFILRNGGNDSLLTDTDTARATLLRDGLAHKIADKAAPSLFNMNYQPVVVFLNGEYYGILNMREHQNDNALRNIYGIEDKENISILSSELDITRGSRYDGSWFYYEADEGPETELNDFTAMMQNICNGLYTYDQIEAVIDTENFMQYCAVNLFLCNTDWPHNNVKVWRYCGPAGDGVRDGRWRFVFKDMDFSMGRYVFAALDEYAPIELYTAADCRNFRMTLCNYIPFDDMFYGFPRLWDHIYPDSLYLQGLLAACLENEGFRNDFLAYCERLATEIWPPEALDTLIREAAIAIRPEIRNMMQKDFGDFPFRITTDFSDWEDAAYGNMDSLLTWAQARSGADGEFLRQARAVCDAIEAGEAVR